MTLLWSLLLTAIGHVFGASMALWGSVSWRSPLHTGIAAAMYFAAIGLWLLLNTVPAPVKGDVGWRVKAMMGGRLQIRAGILSLVWNGLAYGFVAARGLWPGLSAGALTIDGIVAAAAVGLTILGGGLRVMLLSQRLRVARRIVVLSAWWIPLLGLIPLLYLAKVARDEYLHAQYRAEMRDLRVDTSLCRTRYPLVMLHGVGFRDLRYFNYWGRIPHELMRNGAAVYYGNQEAWGSVERNAADVARVVGEVVAATGCEKVNLIAHSKGGLDARCMISSLGMAGRVASLTTISTPHRGCRMVDAAQRLPARLYVFIGRLVDRGFGKLGDTHPEFDVASRQFTRRYVERFNAENPDMPGVYYQSYASVMRFFFSDGLLAVPYLIMYALRGPNDGLVDVETAKWGAFQGVLRTKGWRGISHGDMIDLKREDYRGFDPVEAYVSIVSALREKGF